MKMRVRLWFGFFSGVGAWRVFWEWMNGVGEVGEEEVGKGVGWMRVFWKGNGVEKGGWLLLLLLLGSGGDRWVLELCGSVEFGAGAWAEAGEGEGGGCLILTCKTERWCVCWRKAGSQSRRGGGWVEEVVSLIFVLVRVERWTGGEVEEGGLVEEVVVAVWLVWLLVVVVVEEEEVLVVSW